MRPLGSKNFEPMRLPDFWTPRPVHAVLDPYKAQPSLFAHVVRKYLDAKHGANKELIALLTTEVDRRNSDADPIRAMAA